MKNAGLMIMAVGIVALSLSPPAHAADDQVSSGPTLTPPLTSSQTVTSTVSSLPTYTAEESPAYGQDRAGNGMIQQGQILTLAQCIDIALKQNPTIVAAVNSVEVNRSRIGQARSGYYPQVNATATYDKINPVPGTAAAPLGIRNRFSQYTADVTLNQTILDFGKTSSSVDVAKYNLQSSRADLTTSRDTITLAVKQAYYGVLEAKRNRDVAADIIKQFQLHLDQAEGFYSVGTKAKIDVIKAQVDLSNAQLSLINAENALKISWVILNNTIGVPDAPVYSIEDNLFFQKYPITLEDATARAFENRPDLQSVVAKRQAAEANIGLAKSGHYPVLSGSATYMSGAADIPPSALSQGGLDHGWDVGVAITVPLFSGFLTSHQVAEAKSNLYVLRANEETLRQQILLDIRQAYLNLLAAEASIGTAELATKQSKENLDLANGRYVAGVGSPVEVSDAFATYITSQANYTSSLANYKIAQAAIERAMGMR